MTLNIKQMKYDFPNQTEMEFLNGIFSWGVWA